MTRVNERSQQRCGSKYDGYGSIYEYTKYQMETCGDLAAYFGLMTNNLTNLLTMMGLLIFVVGIPSEIVYDRIAPAFGLRCFTCQRKLCLLWPANDKANWTQ